MIKTNEMIEALARLVGYLQTWRTAEGAYNGYVIHRFDNKRMLRIHDTAWTQAAMIRGYCNLYAKTGQQRWRKEMLLAAGAQARRLDRATGKYRYAGHEDHRFCSLVHCALASCALISAMPHVDEVDAARYLACVCDNLDRYLIPRLWAEHEGAFRFSEVDYYSPHEERFVVNFNTMAAELLLLAFHKTGREVYLRYALRVGDWLKRRLGADALPDGGLPYQFTRTQRGPDDCVTIYAGLALRGLLSLYRATGDEAYSTICRRAARWLLKMRDSQTLLFFHTTRGGAIVPYPQFVAGAGMTLSGLYDARELLETDEPGLDTAVAVLRRAYPNGAVPAFVGKCTCGDGLPRAVWEDSVAAVSWNAQWFEYLTKILPPGAEAFEPIRPRFHARLASRFLYCDSPRFVGIVSWSPVRHGGLYLMRKRASYAWLSIDPRRLIGKVGMFVRRLTPRAAN